MDFLSDTHEKPNCTKVFFCYYLGATRNLPFILVKWLGGRSFKPQVVVKHKCSHWVFILSHYGTCKLPILLKNWVGGWTILVY